MDEELKKALAAAQKAHKEFKAAQDTANAQFAESGRVSAELKAKIEKIEADMDVRMTEAQKVWDEAEKARARELAIGGKDVKALLVEECAKFNSQMRMTLAAKGKLAAFEPADLEVFSTYKKGFKSYLMGGITALDSEPDYRAAMSIGSDPEGGYLVPPDMSGRLIEFIYESSPLRQHANVSTTIRDKKTGRHDLDEAGAEWVGEKSTRSRTSTPDRGKYEIPIHEQHANLPVTQNELDDADEDVEGYLARKAAKKFTRAENTAFVTGTGLLKPRGFTTYTAGTPSASTFNRVRQLATGNAGAFKANPNGPDIFKDMVGDLKTPYLNLAAWAMSRTTLATARKLKDSNGSYQILMERDLRGRPGFLIEGLPVAMFDDMAAIAGGSLSMALADWREAYEIVDRSGIRVLRDPITAKSSGEVEIDFYKRVGGDVTNFDALKLAKFAAS